jgi:hypothetical protein
LDRLLDEPDLHDESIRFAMHLLNNRDAIQPFLRRPDVEATNFRAEQAIRPAVINRKTSGGNRTDRGANAQAILMSILRTLHSVPSTPCRSSRKSCGAPHLLLTVSVGKQIPRR